MIITFRCKKVLNTVWYPDNIIYSFTTTKSSWILRGLLNNKIKHAVTRWFDYMLNFRKSLNIIGMSNVCVLMCAHMGVCVCVCTLTFIWVLGVQTYKCMTLMCNYRRRQSFAFSSAESAACDKGWNDNRDDLLQLCFFYQGCWDTVEKVQHPASAFIGQHQI